MRHKLLIELDACGPAQEWASQYETLQAAWDACKRGDWMLWLCGRLAGPPGDESRKPLVLATCECARLSLKYVPTSETRPRIAIETAERWARQESGVSLADVQAARAAWAAWAAAYADVRTETLAACADIVRKYYPTCPRKGAA